MNLIAAADLNWGIGKNGDLIYSIPEDMRFFRETTSGKTVIMGRSTLESLPGGRPLPKRRNIILSKTLDSVEGAEVARSPEEVLSLVAGTPDKDVFVIGGEQIYRTMLPFCDTAYVTRIDASADADRYLPDLDKDADWEIASRSPDKEHEGINFAFVTYKRIK